MTTISELIEKATSSYPEALEVRYLYPTLYVICTHADFDDLNSEQKSALFSKRLRIAISELEHIKSLGVIEVVLCSPSERKSEYEFLDGIDTGHHWLEWFNPLLWTDKNQQLPSNADFHKICNARALHFYGYKGGQARSTVLLLLAKKLADNGQRVLVVDADVEAPSLDAMLNVTTELPEATLMGLCGWADSIKPITSAYVGHSINSGTVDILACRPRSSSYDMDFAAFTLGTALDTRTLERAIQKLRKFVEDSESSSKYDVVMFDHRTGMTPSLLPIIQSWPGPAVIFARPDGMITPSEMQSVFRTLLAQDSIIPGAFVSFSLDPKEAQDNARLKHGKFIEQLLAYMSDALTRGNQDDDIDPAELEDYWVLWHHDNALLSSNEIQPADLSNPNQKSLDHLIDLLDLKKIEPPKTIKNTQTNLTLSGATDEGWFILTPDIARIFSKESSIRYIFGRKGTGKTRLLRELQTQKLGEPLLVASDYTMGGLPSGGVTFIQLYQACNKDADIFWWTLLRAALECANTEKAVLIDHIKQMLTSGATFNSTSSIQVVEDILKTNQTERTFLIDGVETAVPAPELRNFVEALFRFMAALQYNRTISSKLKIRLFLRSDLWQGASQNVEQQIEGANIILRWDQTSVMNFAVARMASLPWFQEVFPEICHRVEDQREQVARGALSDEKSESLLLNVFPKSLNRNKLKTTTFFSTYFSDAGGDSESKASFYPRLFDAFLKGINDSARSIGQAQALKNSLLTSTIVLQAYDEASGTFINEVRQELYTLLAFDEKSDLNKQAVDLFIENFSGQKTPFVPGELISTLANSTKIETEKVRDALHQMKAMGIFENSPGSKAVWRTGRLYKSGLNMKYVRNGLDKR